MKRAAILVLCGLAAAGCGDDSAVDGGGGSVAAGGGGAGGTDATTASSTGSTNATSTGTGGAPPGPVCDVADPAAREGACSAYAAAVCGFYDRCSVGYVEFVWGTVTACEATMAAGCVAQRNVVEERYLGCLEAYASVASAGCDADPVGTAAGDACDALGTLADGEACGLDDECASGFCRLEGEACGVCAPAPAVGDPCGGGCGALTCILGTCSEPPREGDACALGATGLCDDGSVCSAGRCRRGEPVGEGEACDVERWCDVAEDLVCVEGTCTPWEPATASSGFACEENAISYFGMPSSAISCEPGLRCDFGTLACGPPALPGDACSSDEACTTVACEGGTCTAGTSCTCSD